jgi:hypothetical protein
MEYNKLYKLQKKYFKNTNHKDLIYKRAKISIQKKNKYINRAMILFSFLFILGSLLIFINTSRQNFFSGFSLIGICLILLYIICFIISLRLTNKNQKEIMLDANFVSSNFSEFLHEQKILALIKILKDFGWAKKRVLEGFLDRIKTKRIQSEFHARYVNNVFISVVIPTTVAFTILFFNILTPHIKNIKLIKNISLFVLISIPLLIYIGWVTYTVLSNRWSKINQIENNLKEILDHHIQELEAPKC